ncbi:MAG: D-hydroxyproline dehydrogenase subunit beta [Thermoleophilaceae bacterium]|nr:D-hydroxyproline dehydrogenase subunit beta [Thermoleophilaceae bacterium]
MTGFPDVAIVGGGIVGCAAAAFLAEAGARVELFESGRLAGAASGRNSGSIQHPFDPVMGKLHEETLSHYRELEGFDLQDEPAGVLLLAREQRTLEPVGDGTLLAPDELRRVEPAVGRGLWGCRLDTGYPVQPAAATLAFARRAAKGGALLHQGRSAWPWVIGGGVRGVLAGGEHCAAGAVLVAAGPWTPEVIDPTRAWQPIVPVWGVVVEVSMDSPPRHVLEQAGVDELVEGSPESLFSLVAADGDVSLGSTFLPSEPDPASWAGALKRSGTAFVPALERAKVEGARACARPQSLDGRPLLGPVAGTEGLWVAAGHGPWGISTGPATGRLAADALLGRAEVPRALAAARFDG